MVLKRFWQSVCCLIPVTCWSVHGFCKERDSFGRAFLRVDLPSSFVGEQIVLRSKDRKAVFLAWFVYSALSWLRTQAWH